MAAGVPARLTAAEGRRFAFTLGLAFLALSALLWWRDRRTGLAVTAGIALVLLAAGLLIPARLGPLQRGWLALAAAISRVTTPIFMGVLYFGVLTPVGLIARAFGHRPLHRQGATVWVSRPPQARQSNLNRQF